MSLTVKPFRAFRPQAKRVKEVVLPTFDNLTEKQLNKILKESEYNFLNVVSPEAFYPGISKTNSRKHAYDHLQSMIRNKINKSTVYRDFCLGCLQLAPEVLEGIFGEECNVGKQF